MRILVPLVALAVAAPMAEGASTSIELARTIVAALDAEPAECPDEVAGMGTALDAVCATSAVPFKPFKRSLRSALAKSDKTIDLPGSRWRTRGSYREHRFLVDQELFLVLFDTETDLVALMPHQSCFDDELLRAGDLRVPIKEDGTVLESEIRVQPEFPEQARVQQASGVVIVQVMVDPLGTVDAACVLYAVPEGLGYEEEAVRVARQWRYPAAKTAGRRLANEVLTWQFGADP
jgi:TonB family protein